MQADVTANSILDSSPDAGPAITPPPSTPLSLLPQSSCDQQQEATTVEETPATSSATSAEDPKTEESVPCPADVYLAPIDVPRESEVPSTGRMSPADEGDRMGLLCEVLVEDGAPEHDDMQVDRGQAGEVGLLMYRVVRWPVRLLWSALKVVRKILRAVFSPEL
jgi:hypothetical protein